MFFEVKISKLSNQLLPALNISQIWAQVFSLLNSDPFFKILTGFARLESSLLVPLMLFYSAYVIFVHVTHAHEWAFTHVYTQHGHTWVARGPVDFIPSLSACAWFYPPLPSLPAAVAARLPAAARKGTKAAFVVSLQLHYLKSCPASISGTLGLTCPPVQMLMNWDIVFISVPQFCIFCCTCSLLKKLIKYYFLCPSFCGFSLFPETVVTHC